MADAGLAWALRPASRPQAGGGHMARCSALARRLSAHVPVVIILEQAGEAWRQQLTDAGMPIIHEQDAASSVFAGIVLDDYDLTAEDIVRWRARTSGPVAQIDDFEKPFAGIDLAINATPGLSGDRLNGIPALLGSSYAMLGEAYELRPSPEIRPAVRQVVIGIGLNDAANATSLVMEAVAKALPGAPADILLGRNSPNAADVMAAAHRHSRMQVHFDAVEPWRIAQNADIAISGGGQSLLERMALGIPTIGISVADNQRSVLSGAAAADAIVDLGTVSSHDADSIAAVIAELAHAPERRRALSRAAQELVDGRGAARVADHLLSLSRRALNSASA